MSRRAKLKKVAITTGLAVGIFAGLLGFAANCNRGQDGGSTAGLGFLLGMVYFGAVFGGVMLVYKLFEWVIFGFYREQDDDETGRKAVNMRGVCRKVALVSTIVIAFSCGVSVGLFPLSQYRDAKRSLELIEDEEINYEGRAYYDAMQRVRAQDNYWLNLPKGGLLGLCILFWLFSTIFSFLGIWFVYLFFERFILNLCGVK